MNEWSEHTKIPTTELDHWFSLVKLSVVWPSRNLQGLFQAYYKRERVEIGFGLLCSGSRLFFTVEFRFGLSLFLQAIMFLRDIIRNLTLLNLANPGKQFFTMHVIPVHVVTCYYLSTVFYSIIIIGFSISPVDISKLSKNKVSKSFICSEKDCFCCLQPNPFDKSNIHETCYSL